MIYDNYDKNMRLEVNLQASFAVRTSEMIHFNDLHNIYYVNNKLA